MPKKSNLPGPPKPEKIPDADLEILGALGDWHAEAVGHAEDPGVSPVSVRFGSLTERISAWCDQKGIDPAPFSTFWRQQLAFLHQATPLAIPADHREIQKTYADTVVLRHRIENLIRMSAAQDLGGGSGGKAQDGDDKQGQDGQAEDPLEELNRLHELHSAWQRLYQTASADPHDRAAHQVAAIHALDLHAANLGLLHQCRQEYGGYPDVGRMVTDIEAWATLAPAGKGTEWDCYSLSMESPARQGGHSWGEELDFWIGKCAETAARATARQAVFPTADPRNPSGPDANGTMPDNAERARQFALEVDRLYHTNRNRDRWRKQWAAAVVEAEQWYTHNEEAERKMRPIRTRALDAIWREVRAVEAGKAKRRLTDPDAKPGKYWTFRYVEVRDPEDRRRVQRVEAWVPPGVRRERTMPWPGGGPSGLSLPAQYLVLAVFHDYGFRVDYPKILDRRTAESGAVGDIKRWLLCDVRRTRVSEVLKLYEEGGPSILGLGDRGLDLVEPYLNAVRGDLERQRPLPAADFEKAVPSAPSNRGTSEADALRNVAESLRAWGELNGADSPEARQACRAALGLVKAMLSLIHTVRDSYPPLARQELSMPRLLDRLNDLKNIRSTLEDPEHGEDLGVYWGWWRELTQSPNPAGGWPSFPDMLRNWATGIEQDPRGLAALGVGLTPNHPRRDRPERKESGMSGDTPKVTVICCDETLAACIRAADKTGALKAVITEPDRAIYEYGPAVYVHVPAVWDLEAARRRTPTIMPCGVTGRERPLQSRLDDSGPTIPDFEGVPDNLLAAIREGGILAVAFGEKFVIDETVRQRQRETAGFIEQLDLLDRNMEQETQALVERGKRGGVLFAPLRDYLAKVGGPYVHYAYDAARRWARAHHLEGLPAEPSCGNGIDSKGARAEFAKLRTWFGASKGWIYSAAIFTGLLPVKGLLSHSDSGFTFWKQDPADRAPKAASPEVAWVEPLIPFFMPQIVVLVKAHPLRAANAQVAEDEETPALPLPQAAAARIRKRYLARIPSTEKDTASLYEVDPGEVRIEPVVENAIHQPLGIAVRIRKGAVLVLPECRDEGAKAELVYLLATELWGAVQEWREASTKPASALEKLGDKLLARQAEAPTADAAKESQATAPLLPAPVQADALATGGQEGGKRTAMIFPPDYEPSPGEDWSVPMTMAEIARRLHLDPRTAQDLLAKTGLWKTSRQHWRVRLDTLGPTNRMKVRARPKTNTE